MITRFTLKNIDQEKMDILVALFKEWGIEAKVQPAIPDPVEKGDPFAETRGIWEGRDIDAKKLRMMAMGLIERDCK